MNIYHIIIKRISYMKNKIRLLLIFTFLIIFSYTLLSNKYLGDVEYMNYAYNNYFSEYSLEFKNDDKLDQFIQSLINDKKRYFH